MFFWEVVKMWPVKITGKVKKWPVNKHFWPVIVRWPAVILSPVLLVYYCCSLSVQCKLRSLDAPLLYQERYIRVSAIDLEVLICATRLSQIWLDNHMQNHETVEPRRLYPYSLTNNYDFSKMMDVFCCFRRSTRILIPPHHLVLWVNFLKKLNV